MPKRESKFFVYSKYQGFAFCVALGSFGYLGIKQYYKEKEQIAKPLLPENWTWQSKDQNKKFELVIRNEVVDTNFLFLSVTNALVFLGWKIPALESFMAKWFSMTTVAGMRNLPSMILAAFSHRSFIHLLCNMYVLHSFMQPWQEQPQRYGRKQVSQKQEPTTTDMFVPFYLSAAVMSFAVSFGVKLLTGVMVPTVGASGAIMGMLAYTCCKYPNSHLSLILVPGWSFTAQNGLLGVMLFDAVGLMVMMFPMWFGFNTPFDHAGHLGGCLFGVWYALGGEKKLRQWIEIVKQSWAKVNGDGKDE